MPITFEALNTEWPQFFNDQFKATVLWGENFQDLGRAMVESQQRAPWKLQGANIVIRKLSSYWLSTLSSVPILKNSTGTEKFSVKS